MYGPQQSPPSYPQPWISVNPRICNPVLFLYYRICSTDSGFWVTEFGISLFSVTVSRFWNTNHDFLIRSFVTMVENWYLILNFLPWSRNFLRKNHDLYFKTQNLYYWKEISQILYPRTQNLYYRFCSTEKKLGYRFWDLQILRAKVWSFETETLNPYGHEYCCIHCVSFLKR